MSEQMIIYVMLGVYLVNAASVPLAFIISVWLNIATRPKEKFDWDNRLISFKYQTKVNKDETLSYWLFLDFVGVGLVTLILAFLWTKLTGVVTLSLLVALASPFVVRTILDMGRALKYNVKTGESDRIDVLEKELAKLKSKEG